MKTEIELEAEKLRQEQYIDGSITSWTKNDWQSCWKEGFIEGATSNAAKEYWYKQFEKEKLEFAIEQLRSLPNEYCNIFLAVVEKIKELEQNLSELKQ